jgi:hypothetical protein
MWQYGLYPRASFHFGHFFLALIVKDLCEETVKASNFARETSAFDLIFYLCLRNLGHNSQRYDNGATSFGTREHVHDHELLTNHCRPKGSPTARRIAKNGAQQACYSAPNRLFDLAKKNNFGGPSYRTVPHPVPLPP